MTRILFLTSFLIFVTPSFAAEVNTKLSDAEFERLVTFGCQWFKCGPGTLLEKVLVLQEKIAKLDHLEVTLDDFSLDSWMDADGVRPEEVK